MTSQDFQLQHDLVSGSIIALLGDLLDGLYLHGSAVAGGFEPGRSDIDLLALVNKRPERDKLVRLGNVLHPDSIPHPFPLDLHVVTTDQIQTDSPRWEAWYSTHPAWDGFRMDLDGKVDRDLVLMFEVCRRRGRVLVGAYPHEVFSEIPEAKLLQAIDENLASWQSFDHFFLPEEAVLAACRAWHFVEEGELVSKVEAGEWALDRWAASTVINDALARRTGSDVRVSEPNARILLDHVRRLLQRTMNVDA